MATTYEPIATTTLTSNNTVDFTSIPQTYTDLVLVANVRGARADTIDILNINFNSDTSSIYSYTYMYGTGSTAGSFGLGNPSVGYIGIEYIVAANEAANCFTPVIMHFNNYSNTTTYKTAIVRNDIAQNRTSATVGLWRSTSAISSIQLKGQLTSNLATGSTFTLYGIKAAI